VGLAVGNSVFEGLEVGVVGMEVGVVGMEVGVVGLGVTTG